MRIVRLDLERYGRFTNTILKFRSDAPLHIVLGANERGKTTALSAVTDLLFGFNTSTNYDYLHDKKALRIGAEILTREGRRLSFRRRKGNSNTLLDANEEPLPDDFLATVIGNVSREAFNREFGLTAASLRQGGDELVKAGGRLAETLAAGSAGLASLSALRKSIAAEADELFTARRSGSKEFYVALSRYEEADKKLKAAIVTADAMRTAQEALEAAETNKKTAEQNHKTSSADQRRLERAARTRKILSQIDKIRAQIQELSSLPEIPRLTVQTWKKALEDYGKCVADLESYDRQDAGELREIKELAIDEALLASGTTIDSLREALGAIKSSREHLPKRLSELASAKSELETIARRLGLPDLATLIERRPNDIALTRANNLAERRIKTEDRLVECDELLSKERSEYRKIEQSLSSSKYPEDPAVFRQRLDAVSQVPTNADRLRRETTGCDSEERELLIAAKSLGLSVATLDELFALQTPDIQTIEGFKSDFEGLYQQRSQNEVSQKKLQQSMTTLAGKIERLKRDGADITRDELTGARAQREIAFDKLNSALEEELYTRRESFKATVAITHRVDSITDHLLSDSERATQLQTHKDDLADANDSLDAAKDEAGQISDEIARLDKNWTKIWEAARVIPNSPAEMMHWRQRFESGLESARRLKNRRDDLATLRAELDEAGVAIATLLADYGRPRDQSVAAQILYGEAASWLSDLQENWTALREGNARLEAAKRAVEQAEADQEKWHRVMKEISLQWGDAVSAIGLLNSATSTDVRTAVELWNSMDAPKLIYDDRTHRATAMQNDIDKFVQEVESIATIVSPGLRGEAEIVLKTVADNLTQSRQAAQTRDVLQRKIDARVHERSKLLNAQEHLASILGSARTAMGADDNIKLTGKLEQLDAREGLKNQLLLQADSLADSGDGLPEEILRTEQVGLNFDTLPGDIDRLKIEISGFLTEISSASVAVASAKKVVEDLGQGRNAAGVARDLQEAFGEIAAVSRKWIMLSAAERLAGRAIEQYRASVQDPLLTRAAAYFKSATAETFSDLAVDFDERDQPSLVAVRQTGEKVPVSGLSEGTRDQLFLSLRLAILGMRTAEPLPFIADDLLSSFDDERTACTISLLRAFGQSSQTIVFTHHAHVADIARAVSPDVEILEFPGD